MSIYPVSVSGESQANPDGSSRQREIAKLRIGEAVSLIREPENQYDANADLILSSRGTGIGYVERATAKWVAKRIDQQKPIAACVASVAKADGAKLFGVVIAVATDGEDPRGIFDDPDFNFGREAPAKSSSSVGQAIAKAVVFSLIRAITKRK